MKGHAGDCTIYAALINGSPTDGICTCGYGWSIVSKGDGDWSEMYSEELSNKLIEKQRGRKPMTEEIKQNILEAVFTPLNENA